MKRSRFAWTLTFATAISMAAANPARAVTPNTGTPPPAMNMAKCVDLALTSDGSLQGQVVNEQTVPDGRVDVVLFQGGREMARTATDAGGNFRFIGLRGGQYALATGNSVTHVRAWRADAAPPAAQPAVLIVDQQGLARGQDGGFWKAVSNPWVCAGLIAAAVAIPIALSNNDSGS